MPLLTKDQWNHMNASFSNYRFNEEKISRDQGAYHSLYLTYHWYQAGHWKYALRAI